MRMYIIMKSDNTCTYNMYVLLLTFQVVYVYVNVVSMDVICGKVLYITYFFSHIKYTYKLKHVCYVFYIHHDISNSFSVSLSCVLYV